MSDIDSDDSDDSVFSEESVEDDSAEAKRRIRRAYRPKQYRSLGVLSKEWIAARDAMVRGDAAGFAKTMAMIRKRDRKVLSYNFMNFILLFFLFCFLQQILRRISLSNCFADIKNI